MKYNRSFSNRPRGPQSYAPRRSSGLTKEQRNYHPSMFIKKAERVEDDEFIPTHSFNDFEVVSELKTNIFARGYEYPTPIQDQVIPYVLAGRDIVGLAHTGTGKTAAFLVPLIHKIRMDDTQKVLIVAPTRELAIQIEDELKLFSKGMNIFSALVIGGGNMKRQIDRIRRKHHFIIGTPGRIIDLEKRGIIKLYGYQSVVLDEVDRMLDMGFIRDMTYIVSRLPQKRQSLFFSATLPKNIESLMRSFLQEPITVSVKTERQTSLNVDQDVIRINGRNKVDLLHDVLIQEGFNKVLIFGRTKHGMNNLFKDLLKRGFKVDAIHGNKSQMQRKRALDAFKLGNVQVLLATDLASRGLDIDDITHVINYDLPQSYEDYIHRIGRTGRANKTGIALTLMP
ncbi:hypothetical protein A2957_01130 [Candidatus Roizmanbacteria bacterium RIFCSPLOWO2_01_FULL_38_11]|uniref:DEAD/DEAH box helicase n=1 Tax=Candidatus Roizmanbacteria bacterium RIFCSPLOWO2_01_FULL_38_11 TaxID=1802060 RepID=A0A1F7INQ1_9BACT|nr:MAG: hypothetical protein A2957_01130 [Candidatus Roizmanbacteria bacterium RIFCSPLOWO2_01_FULL_38_11]